MIPIAIIALPDHSLRFARNRIPIKFCLALGPTIIYATPALSRPNGLLLETSRRRIHIETALGSTQGLPTDLQLLDLPKFCPGCGALSQIVSSGQPGYYSIKQKSVRAFLDRYGEPSDKKKSREPETFDRALSKGGSSLLSTLGLEGARIHTQISQPRENISKPFCTRCHNLIHHNFGVSIIHPTLRSIKGMISESPYKLNHIYHVIDAADFPLSLIPSLQKRLSLASQRSLNRRAKASHFQHGRKDEMSFIITRSDLLAPRKEQVDSLMPYLMKVLRNALGKSAENARLGNVQCVSSKRGWWTKQVKEDIWNRGGGGWMIGKVNVGKSNLFESVFPKVRSKDIGCQSSQKSAPQSDPLKGMPSLNILGESQSPTHPFNKIQQEERSNVKNVHSSLLPPAPLETLFPTLPLVSSVPGTTASPIRVPFGSGKGELIDLPGLSRDGLEDFVLEHHKTDLLMRQRVKPEQLTIKPGQSLCIGGLVRITPVTPDVTVLACPFVPLQCHVTSTEKATAIHAQKDTLSIGSIAKQGLGDRMVSAGTFPLEWDVTKQRAGPLTEKTAVGLSPSVLPFVVLSIDVLIEGCGWVELVAQVRKKHLTETSDHGDLFDSIPHPRIEIISPDGRHIGVRQPMCAWSFCHRKPGSARECLRRPRPSMKGVKKRSKLAQRKRLL